MVAWLEKRHSAELAMSRGDVFQAKCRFPTEELADPQALHSGSVRIVLLRDSVALHGSPHLRCERVVELRHDELILGVRARVGEGLPLDPARTPEGLGVHQVGSRNEPWVGHEIKLAYVF